MCPQKEGGIHLPLAAAPVWLKGERGEGEREREAGKEILVGRRNKMDET